MSKQFTLAGLLRLRRMQEDTAATTLAAANNRLAVGAARRAAARAGLGESDAEVSTAAAMAAMAAARASSHSMLADLQSLAALDAEAAQSAQEAFNAARLQTKGLEKLSDKHAATVAAGELAAEQVAIDEIASGAWHREHADTIV